MSRWGVAVALAQALLPAGVAAQLGEAQYGVIGSYGTSNAWHGGAGLIAEMQVHLGVHQVDQVSRYEVVG